LIKEIEKNRIRKENPARQKLKMLLARVDCACPWTVLESASYLQAHLHRLKQNPTFKYGSYNETLNETQ
jgi:hypothetical protein